MNERFSAIHFQREKSCYFNETFVSLPHSLHHYLTPLIEHSALKSDNDENNTLFTYLKSFFHGENFNVYQNKTKIASILGELLVYSHVRHFLDIQTCAVHTEF